MSLVGTITILIVIAILLCFSVGQNYITKTH